MNSCRKPLYILVALLFSFSLAACAGGDDPFGTEINQGDGSGGDGSSGDGSSGDGSGGDGSGGDGSGGDGSGGDGSGGDGSGGDGEVDSSCISDQDCSGGEVCALIAQGTTLEATCVPDNSGALAGGACSLHSQCRSQYCLDGVCSAPCADESVCGEFQVCEPTPAAKDGASATLDLCVPLNLCASNQDCDTGLMCNSVFELPDETLQPLCGSINPTGSGLGEVCTSTASCQSRFCWPHADGTSGSCTVFCEESDRDCGPTQVCGAISDDFGVCLGSCTRDDDCRGGDVCFLDVDPNENRIHGFCIEPFGALAVGEECASSMECQSGLCLTMTGGQITQQFCNNNDECPSEYPTCGCPPDNPGCFGSERRCMLLTEESRCSTSCDMANGDADCQGGHVMDRCDDQIRFSWTSGSELVSACAMSN